MTAVGSDRLLMITVLERGEGEFQLRPQTRGSWQKAILFWQARIQFEIGGQTINNGRSNSIWREETATRMCGGRYVQLQ